MEPEDLKIMAIVGPVGAWLLISTLYTALRMRWAEESALQKRLEEGGVSDKSGLIKRVVVDYNGVTSIIKGRPNFIMVSVHPNQNNGYRVLEECFYANGQRHVREYGIDYETKESLWAAETFLVKEGYRIGLNI